MGRITFVLSGVLCLCLSSCHKGISEPKSSTDSWMDIQKSITDEKPLDPPLIETIFQEERFVFEGVDSYSRTWVHQFKILTENAREEYGVWTIDYHLWHESKPKVDVTVTQPDGSVVELDPSTIVDQATDQSGQVISNGRRVTIPVPQLKIGSIVKIQSSSTYSPSVYGPGMSSWMNFGSYYRDIRNIRLVLDYPSAMQMKIKQYAMDIVPVVTENNGRNELVFEQKSVKRIRPPESNIPEDMIVLPILMFATGESWEALAAEYYKRIEPLLNISACKNEVRQLIPENGDEKSKMDGLLANLKKKIRYTGLELGENAIVPVSPCETLKRGYGDCKDQAALLIGALGEMGIKSNMVLLNATNGLDVESELPSLTEFNHVIVRVDDPETTWIDPTLTFGRVGELGITSQNRNGLVISKRTQALVKTPKRQASHNTVREIRTIHFSEYGKATVVEETQYAGTFERYERSNAIDSDEESMFESLEEYIKKAYSAKSLKKAQRVDPSDLGTPFGYLLEGNEIEVAATDLESAVSALTPWSVFHYLPNAIDPTSYKKEDTEETRYAPFALETPGRFTVEYRLKAPEEYVVKPLPKNQEFKFGSFTVSSTYKKVAGNEVHAVFNVDTGDGTVDAKSYQKFRRRLLKWTADFPIMITFEHEGMGFLASGDNNKAVAFLQKSEQKGSQNYIRKLRYASALLDVGFGKPAREAALAATRLAPDKPEAWRYLGWVLEHNDLGHRFGKGFTRSKAIDAYRRAISADEQETDARFALAILLEHDEEGDRYMNTDDLKKAIAEYQAILEIEEDNDTVKKNLVVAMSQAREFEALREQIKEEPKDNFYNSYRVICTAAIEGAAEAVKEAKTLFEEVDDRRDALGTAVSFLMKTGSFSDCAILLREAYKGLSNSEALTKAKLFEDMAKLSEEKRSGKIGSPEELAQQILINGVAEKPTPLQNYWAPSLRELLPSDADTTFYDAMKKKMKSLIKTMSTKKIKEIMVNIFSSKKEGNDKDGYRLVLQPKIGNGKQVVFHMVKEDGKYYVAGIGDMKLVGQHIWNLLKKERLQTARKWLDWSTRSGQMRDEFVWKHNCEGDAQRAQVAAWHIMALDEDIAKTAVAAAEAQFATAKGEHRQRILRVLFVGYSTLKKYDELFVLAKDELDGAEDKTRPFYYLQRAALKTARYQELKSIGNKLHATDPDEKMYAMSAEKADVWSGKMSGFWKKRSTQTDALEPAQYNLLAWITLFEIGTLEEGLDFALKAVQKKERSNRYKYHTLASIYAELGKTAEAHQIMKSLHRSDSEPDSGDWFVFGRMAEHYNLKKIAVDYYCKVERPEVPNAISTYHLARKQIKSLRGHCGKKKK